MDWIYRMDSINSRDDVNASLNKLLTIPIFEYIKPCILLYIQPRFELQTHNLNALSKILPSKNIYIKIHDNEKDIYFQTRNFIYYLIYRKTVVQCLIQN